MCYKNEMRELDQIDRLTSSELIAGDDNVSHDGVELSIQGSDIDEFMDEENETQPRTSTSPKSAPTQSTEPGEVSSCDEEDQLPNSSKRKVASKVVQPTKSVAAGSSKYDHLRHDPEFRQFLSEMVGEQINKDKKETVPSSTKSKKGNSVEPKLSTPKNPHMIKSPSDTTIYSPGLRHASNEDISLIEKISNFVGSIRIDDRKARRE